jgi:hypothetical protein
MLFGEKTARYRALTAVTEAPAARTLRDIVKVESLFGGHDRGALTTVPMVTVFTWHPRRHEPNGIYA